MQWQCTRWPTMSCHSERPFVSAAHECAAAVHGRLSWTGICTAPYVQSPADSVGCMAQVLNILLNMESAHRAALQHSTQQPHGEGAWVKWRQRMFFKGVGRRLLEL